MATLDEKGKFDKLVGDRMDLIENTMAGLRDSILTNQTLRALVYIERALAEIKDDLKKVEPAAEKAPAKKTAAKKTSKKAPAKKTAAKKEEEDEVEATSETVEEDVQE